MYNKATSVSDFVLSVSDILLWHIRLSCRLYHVDFKSLLRVTLSVSPSSKYFEKVLKERFLNLIDVRLVIIRLREASLLMVLSVGFQRILKN